MTGLLEFIANTFDLNLLALFIISSLILIFLDSKDFKKNKNMREYRFARFFGYFYIGAGIILYVLARSIRL